jgi:hypothetical protein
MAISDLDPTAGYLVAPIGASSFLRGFTVVESGFLKAGEVYFIKKPRLDVLRPRPRFDFSRRLSRGPQTDDMRQMLDDLAAKGWQR